MTFSGEISIFNYVKKRLSPKKKIIFLVEMENNFVRNLFMSSQIKIEYESFRKIICGIEWEMVNVQLDLSDLSPMNLLI